MTNLPETQPVITSATITSLVTAILVLLVSFGLPITEDQRNAVLGLVAVVAPFAVIWWAQRKTTPLVDPKVTTPEGKTVPLVRADNQQPTPQAMQAAKIKWERGG